jgi:ferredoxin
MTVKIITSKCIGCAVCVLSCPTYAMHVPWQTFQCTVDGYLCNQCLLCIDYCPADAIEEAKVAAEKL